MRRRARQEEQDNVESWILCFPYGAAAAGVVWLLGCKFGARRAG